MSNSRTVVRRTGLLKYDHARRLTIAVASASGAALFAAINMVGVVSGAGATEAASALRFSIVLLGLASLFGLSGLAITESAKMHLGGLDDMGRARPLGLILLLLAVGALLFLIGGAAMVLAAVEVLDETRRESETR